MIEIKNAKKHFGSLILFEKLDLEIKNPGIYALTGKSGCGKTTLLQILAGFEPLSSGTVRIHGKSSFIFQNYELVDELNIKENILLSNRDFDEKEAKLIRNLGIENLLTYYPKEISGGQKQRVGIARAMLLNPQVILCDEPTESLDIDNKNIVMSLLKEMSKEVIVVIVSHDSQMISQYADTVYLMENGEISIQKENCSPLTIVSSTKLLSRKKDTKWIMKRILRRKSFYFATIFLFIATLLCTVFGIEQRMFYKPLTTYAMNKDMLYITTNTLAKVADTLELSMQGFSRIMDFNNIQANNRNYISFTYPYVESDLPFVGELPTGTQIIINQNVQKELNIQLEDKPFITLTYNIAGMENEVKAEVVGIIQEEDAQTFNLYYDLEGMLELLKNSTVPGGENAYAYFLENEKNYQYEARYENFIFYYEQKGDIGKSAISNPLYDQRINSLEQELVYKWVYTAIEIIFLAGLVLFLSIYLNKDASRQQRTYSIFVTMGFALKDVKTRYIIEKSLSFYPIMFLLAIGVGVVYLLGILRVESLVIFGIVYASILLLYFFLLIYHVLSWREKQINSILKEDN